MIFIKPEQYKANLHCHSTLSDGKLSPEELKKAYKEKGYSILAITDHERTCNHSALCDENFLTVTGYEAYIRPGKDAVFNVFNREIHLNLFAKKRENIGLVNPNSIYLKYYKKCPEVLSATPKYGSDRPREYTVEYLNEYIDVANKNGYLVALNHPVWSFENQDFLLKLNGLFSMEMFNYGSYLDGNFEYNSALYDTFLRNGKRLFCHSADDNHNRYPFNTPNCDSFGGFTMINTKDNKLTYEAVIEALQNGDFYSSTGPIIKSLEIKDGVAKIECSGVKAIIMNFGAKDCKTKFSATNDDEIFGAEFDLPQDYKYIRFTVRDKYGNNADTRAYFKDEL